MILKGFKAWGDSDRAVERPDEMAEKSISRGKGKQVKNARKKGEASFDSSPGCSVELPRLLGETACNFSFVMKRTGRD